jgi:hypothetical protein
MFYCEPCRKAKKWPQGLATSVGTCGICKQKRECYDVPSSSLPRVRSPFKDLALVSHDGKYLVVRVAQEEKAVYRTGDGVVGVVRKASLVFGPESERAVTEYLLGVYDEGGG